MGWYSGTELFQSLITLAMDCIPNKKTREKFYIGAIRSFEDSDWDNSDECLGIDEAYDLAYDRVMKAEKREERKS